MKTPVFAILFSSLLTLTSSDAFSQSALKLWYDRPAEYFEETLVLGNGIVGASVFGAVEKDQIYLNDATLWAGEPVDPNMNPDAHKHIPAIREALANEDYRLADQLNKHIQGKFSQSFAPLGTLFLEFDHSGAAENYYRELDISQAIAKVRYDVDGVHFTREYFVSHPAQIMIIKLKSSQQGSLNFRVKFGSLLKYQSSHDKEMLQIDGYAPFHAEPSYRGEMPNAVQFDKQRGTRFSTYLQIQQEGGEVAFNDSSISVTGANEATLHVSIATSFNGFDKDPAREGRDNKLIAKNQLNRSLSESYKTLVTNHIEDYQHFFNRVSLTLDDRPVTNLPTNERLKKYTHGAEDNALEILYFQFGRYLMIASSRTDGVPANLQGIWNPYMRPPWSSNYTMNINVQENYWLAESANLPEMHRPFLSFIGNLATTGKITARTFYGIEQGWVACHNSDIWAMSNPVGDFGKGHPVWACWNMAGPWHVTHLWEHYLYNGDLEFLKTEAYPLMKGAAEFCLAWLIEDKQGNLTTSPSTSPENLYLTPDGYKGATLYGATSDLAMIRECFQQTIEAAKVLDIDTAFQESLQNALDRLYPYQVGSRGHLQEWYHDWEDADPQHRHQSHLFGLHPGHHITPEKTPALAAACRKSLEIKGDETTGWSKGWRINLWARLHDGNRAYKMFRELLSYVEPDAAEKTQYSGGGGTYPNLFDAHPPFQIDGNFGGAAGVIEMLLQSHEDNVHLLPALPNAWPSGSVSGIRARGGFELSIRWNDGRLTAVEILSTAGKQCRLRYKDQEIVFDTEAGNIYRFDGSLTKLN